MADDHVLLETDWQPCPTCGGPTKYRITISFSAPPEPREPGDLPPDADQGRDDPPEGFR